MRFFLLFFLFFKKNSISQDTVRLTHTNYTTVFSKTKKYPILVQWVVTTKMVTCSTPLKRKDNFKPDPKLPKETDISSDFIKSGFDRGHMMPAADNLCQTQKIQDECFYFSNMSAQYRSLNAGDWKSLEVFVREKAKTVDSIFVWAGNLGEMTNIGTTTVPSHCWKLIYIKKENTWMSFMFQNSQTKPDGFENNMISKELLEQKTGLTFKID